MDHSMRRGAINDHIGAYNWKATVDSISIGNFQAVSGLSMKMEVIEYQDGTDLFVRKRPGRKSFGAITLKKGYIDNIELRKWWESIMNGLEDRRSMMIELQDNLGDPICSWDLFECWPSEWKVSEFDGKSNNAVTEEITIQAENVIYKRA
ncbi:MAG: phage tail protein [Myxococcota bacterium]